MCCCVCISNLADVGIFRHPRANVTFSNMGIESVAASISRKERVWSGKERNVFVSEVMGD